MALTVDQLSLLRLMIANPRARVSEDQLKEWAEMPDQEILSVVDDWKQFKLSNPFTPQGLVEKINALEA